MGEACPPNLDVLLTSELERGIYVRRSAFGTNTYDLLLPETPRSAWQVSEGTRCRLYASTRVLLLTGPRSLDECQRAIDACASILGCTHPIRDISCRLMNINRAMPYTIRLDALAAMTIPGSVVSWSRDTSPHVLTVLVRRRTSPKPTKVLVYRTGRLCIHARSPSSPMEEGERLYGLLRPLLERAKGLPLRSKTESS